MNHKLTIHFAIAEDCAWALDLIERCRKRTKEMLPYGGTPLAGGTASILLCSLGRSTKTVSKMTLKQAKAVRSGYPVKAKEAA